MIEVAFTWSPPSWIRMLPQALMLAATCSTVPEDGAEEACDDPAEDIAEPAPAGEDAAVAGADEAATVDEELPDPAGEAVLDEPQAASPKVTVTAAADTKMDRRNIENTPISDQVEGEARHQPTGRRPVDPFPAPEANSVLIVVVNIAWAL